MKLEAAAELEVSRLVFAAAANCSPGERSRARKWRRPSERLANWPAKIGELETSGKKVASEEFEARGISRLTGICEQKKGAASGGKVTCCLHRSPLKREELSHGASEQVRWMNAKKMKENLINSRLDEPGQVCLGPKCHHCHRKNHKSTTTSHHQQQQRPNSSDDAGPKLRRNAQVNYNYQEAGCTKEKFNYYFYYCENHPSSSERNKVKQQQQQQQREPLSPGTGGRSGRSEPLREKNLIINSSKVIMLALILPLILALITTSHGVRGYQLTNNLIANNLPPKFITSQPGQVSNSEIVVRVKEGAGSIGKLIYTLKGEDPDDDPLTFNVLGSMASDLLRIENVPGNQANVYLRKELDRETTESYQVVITLTDGKLGRGNWVSEGHLCVVVFCLVRSGKGKNGST